MKFLFISRAMGFYFGGTENYEVGLAKILKIHGHEVDFLIGSPLSGKIKNLEKLNDFNIIKCKGIFLKNLSQKLFHFNGRLGKLFFSLDNYFFKKTCFGICRELFLNTDYDIIQISGQVDLAYNIKKYLNKKVILFFPGILDPKKIGEIMFIDGVFSDGYAYKMLKEFHSHSDIIYGGVNNDIYYSKRDELMTKKKLAKEGEKVILMVNRLVFLKNLSLAIKIAKELKNKKEKFKLIIVGEGPDKHKLESIIKKYKLEKYVKLLGFMPHDMLYKYYSAADIFLLTSSFDNFPNVIKEAMTVGLPIVASNNSGIKMQIENRENGFLCNNLDDFVNNILFLFSNKNEARLISQKNKNKAEKIFIWNNNYKRYINFINSLK